MRIVIGLGDVAKLDGEPVGDLLALVVRIETVTPADEIYLTSAARHALTPAEVQTSLVDHFVLKGFAEPVAVYRVALRHRTHVIPDIYLLLSDLRGFRRFIESEQVVAIEGLIDLLDAMIRRVTEEFQGTIRFSVGDSYCLTFHEASKMIAAAERLAQEWDAANRETQFACAIKVALHRGTICAFRSFLYGEGIAVAARVQDAMNEILASSEGGIFLTRSVRDALSESHWHDRLQQVASNSPSTGSAGLELFRLPDANPAIPPPPAPPQAA